ncbi:hypothetical protein ABB37_00494 [Leptomonas pyrrhocoris]|uniref:Uncharacterized protein n=1 Tax=Leptomonas pyrrhocoris TaxID=157538 RepID=A0A0N0E0B9_LEPPY|nr:hypothetical protein ABB37_00494 [Leptomonas pyrrhocoris]XP_015664705.1 hypothetical protein ABB37_00494 [Leptomonas pyrrhocoris]KPA86265.1 hypothetical protein ABB37_00494 [Leptomonas pyrrhocoris]KPA86266.1 hypothetical protein ABB37_00494 [Leptomonas pyrrhocoris]|eukprot:XP_015664704.1 hypothetical protein ABB37_00494 [Leptomonas pyrrhocoris]
MEVGKLVTSETCGNIFYFVVDETHPDEPRSDASKCHYVVAPSTNAFSYREAFYVLCRALCGLENRTYLHRWHSLHQQIFGSTTYVQFVNAVRESPLAQPNTFSPTGPSSSPTDAHSRPSVALPALFLDETTARLALRTAERGHQAVSEVSAPAQAPQRHSALQGFSTPISKPQPTTPGNTVAVEMENGSANPRKEAEVPHNTEVECCEKESGKKVGRDQGLDARWSAASQWQATAAASHGGDRRSVSSLKQGVHQERVQRCETEEAALHPTDAVREAGAHAKKQPQPVQPWRLADAAESGKERNAPAVEEMKTVTQLKRRIQELEMELAEREQRHALERDSFLAEKDALKQQLWQQSQAQGTQINEFLQENAGAVRRVEEALEKREKELCAVYTQALEERDVRIAQLSQEILQHLQSSRQLVTSRSDQERFDAERVAHLEDMTSQLKEWNGSLRDQLREASDEIRDLRQRLQPSTRRLRDGVVEDPPLKSAFAHNSFPSKPSALLFCGACAGLPRAAAVQLAHHLRETEEQLGRERADAERRAGQLRRAAHVIEQLTRGVQEAKTGVSAFPSP